VASVWEVGTFVAGGAGGVLMMVFMVCLVVNMVTVLVFGGRRNKENKQL
jgi:hypothetical protein